MSDLTWETIRDTVPCTYRQLDHWIRLGLITADPSGTGHTRTLTRTEFHVLRILAELVAAGLKPSAAAPLARQLVAADVGSLGGKFHVSRAS